ncbi:MAG: hypothetical protein KC457_24545, partial [Myxococcales bacterium]|nr:hypothetical protein [Myxococcales bacterium]
MCPSWQAEVRYHDPACAVRELLIDDGGVPGRRVEPPLRRQVVTLENIRTLEQPPCFAADGLGLISFVSPLREAADFETQREDYEQAVVECLGAETGAREVVIYDHTLRDEANGARPPSHHVHCDNNRESARQRLINVLGEERAGDWLAGRFAIVNLWRALAYPVERSPLGLVHPDSVDAGDWVDVDVVFPHRRSQVVGVLPNPGHRWLFCEGMGLDEALIF